MKQPATIGTNLRTALALAALLACAPAARAQAAADASLKIAFVYNLAKFTEWPQTVLGAGQKQAVLCFAGDPDAYAAGLAAIEGRQLGGREVRVRRLGRPAEPSGCHILYVARTEERRLPDLLAQAHAQSALTVSDIADFAESEGIIGLVNVDNKVQFEINLRSARVANLKISSEVLKLARNVIGR